MGVKIKFDSKKLERQIKEQSLKIAKQDIIKNGTEGTCPECSHVFTVKPGVNTCPDCGNEFTVKIK